MNKEGSVHGLLSQNLEKIIFVLPRPILPFFKSKNAQI
jgi:hypothetical protein